MSHSHLFEQLIQLFKSHQHAAQLSVRDWEALLFVLKTARLEAALGFRLQTTPTWSELPAKVKRHLTAAMTYADRQRAQVIHEGAELHQLLTEQGITPVFLKGAAYLVAETDNAYGRLCSDIDLLVKLDDLEASESTLINHLWYHKTLTEYDDKYYREFAHEIPPLYHLQRGTVLDLHHNLFLPVSGKAPTLDAYWSNILKSKNGVYTLEPAGMFMHSVIHLMLNEEIVFGFRDILDLRALAIQFDSEPFWQRVEALAVTGNFVPELNVVVQLLVNWFNIAVPEKLCGEINANRYNRLLVVLYSRALVPDHPSLNTFSNKVARQLIFIRGHWMKMPFPVLLKHFSIKAGLSIRNWFRGDKTADRKPVDLGQAFKQ